MKIFLTGATGFVGSTVAEKLQEAGHSVLGLARTDKAEARLRERNIQPVRGDLRDPAALVPVVSEADGVIHTALAWDAGMMDALELDRRLVRALIEALAGTDKPLIVSSGTSSLGDTGSQPADETASVNLEVAQTQADLIVLDGAKQGVRTAVIRLPAFPYGRGGSLFVPLLVQKALQDKQSYYIGSGENKSSAVHIDDAARLFVLALEKAAPGSLYHASTQYYTTKAIAEAIGRLTDTPTISITAQEADSILGPFAWLFALTNQVKPAKAERELDWHAQETLSLLDDIKHGSYRQLLAE